MVAWVVQSTGEIQKLVIKEEISVALQTLNFEFQAETPETMTKEWSHLGVTGSGDLEVLMEKKNLGGKVQAKVVTPVKGFDEVWRRMLGKFVNDCQVGDVSIEINDDNATPIVVYMRLRQAWAESSEKEAE
jgi:malonate decarboxylase delta subunit